MTQVSEHSKVVWFYCFFSQLTFCCKDCKSHSCVEMTIPDHTRRLSWSPAGHVITTNALHIPSWRARMSLAIQRLGVATSAFVKTKVWNALRGSTRLTRSSATASIFCYFLLSCLFTRLHASKFKLSQAHGHIWTLDTIQNQGLPFLWRDILIILWCSQAFSKPFILFGIVLFILLIWQNNTKQIQNR